MNEWEFVLKAEAFSLFARDFEMLARFYNN